MEQHVMLARGKQNENGGQKWTCYTYLALRDVLAADELD